MEGKKKTCTNAAADCLPSHPSFYPPSSSFVDYSEVEEKEEEKAKTNVRTRGVERKSRRKQTAPGISARLWLGSFPLPKHVYSIAIDTHTHTFRVVLERNPEEEEEEELLTLHHLSARVSGDGPTTSCLLLLLFCPVSLFFFWGNN